MTATPVPTPPLAGKKTLVVDVANEHSIAWGCAKAFHELGAAAPLMTEGGTLFAMSYYGAGKVVDNYNLMGPVKAALEAACRYFAFELGPRRIRVHPILRGPLKMRAASGLKDFDLLLADAAQKAPIGELADIMDVGFACAYLATPYARRITGGTIYVDGGVHVVA
ncbi:MAG: SDR family oxidoreductase [Burkholderiales bacterium]